MVEAEDEAGGVEKALKSNSELGLNVVGRALRLGGLITLLGVISIDRKAQIRISKDQR